MSKKSHKSGKPGAKGKASSGTRAEADRRRKREDRESLAPAYVKQLLIRRTSLKPAEVPPDLVEIKTLHLQVIRLLKKQKGGAK